MTKTIGQLQNEIDKTAFEASHGKVSARSKFCWGFEIDGSRPVFGYGTIKQAAREALLKYGKPASSIKLVS